MTRFDRAPFIQPSLALPVLAGGSDGRPPVTAEQVTAGLRSVFDPEVGLSVVELGLVYGIEIEGARVTVTMTLTAPGCPIHDAMTDWVREAVKAIPGVGEVEVRLTFDPPWTPERMQVHPAE